MASLITRISKLEKATAGALTPDKWSEAKILVALMRELTCPPDPAIAEEAMKRIKENMASTDPENPGMPPSDIIMLAGKLKVDLEPFAVNDEHRKLIRDMYSSV